MTDEAWMEAFLARAPIVTVASVDGCQPFLHPNTFVFDPARRAIYLHTSRKGRFRDNVEQSPAVCLSVFEMGRLLPAPRAVNLSVEYESLVVFGRVTVLDDESEARHGLDLLCRKYFPTLAPGADYELPDPRDLARTAVYRIDVEAWSGKRKTAPPDHPGAPSP